MSGVIRIYTIEDFFWKEVEPTCPIERAACAIMDDLVRREGRAVWIPKFVEWLFENYEVKKREPAN